MQHFAADFYAYSANHSQLNSLTEHKQVHIVYNALTKLTTAKPPRFKCMDWKGRIMHFLRSSVVMATVAFLAFTPMTASHAFSIKGQVETESEGGDINNKKFQKAAVLEAKAYICGTGTEASEAAMRAGMAETGLPEDIAIEVVSDLASGIIDQATRTGSKKMCGKPEIQMSSF
ncbi:hypothetical protein [Phyllobacterium sp. YR531]|uniref:hypothetical protein n=1 Tax=Phyllobacterium sp. YR531 TaxID=1144343 RepID=UPI0012F678A6|nr:hypothetical protein [Phyllobacterium sp. YR531]